MEKISVAVLITCHNRKIKTLECLKSLFEAKKPKEFLFEIFLVDDGSSDGTGEAVNSLFPNIHIIQGDGNLFWNKGMNLAWQEAQKNGDFDYFLWLNDDTFLYPDVLQKLQIYLNPNIIIGGSTFCKKNNKVSYGGYINNRLITPTDKFESVDCLNGNFVIVPNEVVKINGILDPYFHHALGDFDYTLRAKKKGIELKLLPFYVGDCESNVNIQFWADSSNNIIDRFKYLYSPLSGCQYPDFFVFDIRHKGLIIAIVHFLTIHLRAISPRFWEILK